MQGKPHAAAVFAFGFLTTFGAAARADDLASPGDDFNAAASLAKWKNFDTEFGWPNRLTQVGVGAPARGARC